MRGKEMSGFPERSKALEDFFALWEPERQTELVPLETAIGRITAGDLFSENTLPVARSSGCDGIAVRSIDFESGMPDYKTWVRGEDYDRADTGDDFDDRFDAVIMIEEVDFDEAERIIYISPDIQVRAGTNVNPSGSTIKKGDLLIRAGLPIRPTDLASLAMGGIIEVPVIKKPRVAFLPTGSELVPYTKSPARGQNVDANSPLMEATLRELGAEPLLFPICPDDPDALLKEIDQALSECDLLILNAGTAKGEEDFNFGLLGDRGQLVHHYIAAAPGRPMALAIVDGKPVVNMPGPTMAAFYTCEWCINRCVARLLGIPPKKHETVRATLMNDIRSGENMAILIRMDVYKSEDGYVCRSRPFRGASLPSSLSSNAMYVSDIGESYVPKGAEIEVELLRGREYITEL